MRGTLLPWLIWGAAAWGRLAPPRALAGLAPLHAELSPPRPSSPLAAFYAAHPGARVALSVDSAMRLPPALRDRLALVYDETGRKASPWAVAEERP